MTASQHAARQHADQLAERLGAHHPDVEEVRAEGSAHEDDDD